VDGRSRTARILAIVAAVAASAYALVWMWAGALTLFFGASDSGESIVALTALGAAVMTAVLLTAGIRNVREPWKSQRLWAWAAASFSLVILSWETLISFLHRPPFFTPLVLLAAGGALATAYGRRHWPLRGNVIVVLLSLVLLLVPWTGRFPWRSLSALLTLLGITLPGWSAWLATFLVREEPPVRMRTPSRLGPAQGRALPDTARHQPGSLRRRT